MTLNEYQQRAMTTCLPESRNFSYMMLNLMSEVGDVDTRMDNKKPVKRNPGSDACKVDNVQCLCDAFILEEQFNR